MEEPTVSIYTSDDLLAERLQREFKGRDINHYWNRIHMLFNLPMVETNSLLNVYDTQSPLAEYELYLSGTERLIRLRTFWRGGLVTLTDPREIARCARARVTTPIDAN
ncbi:hypothetical protein HYZ97_04875 [Candidatus Pacearchaeota archaeon]|nr:hypothetical protein [Candidatus Pacearchaeota archaeon]